jgi:hypothetical protein
MTPRWPDPPHEIHYDEPPFDGPPSKEITAFYVERGILSKEEGAYWLKRLSRHGRGRHRMEDDEFIRERHARIVNMRRQHPDMSWEQIAAHENAEPRQLFRWLDRLGR